MQLLVGLGNPGERYARTRHNVGFMAIDRIAEQYRFNPWKKKFQGLVAEGEIDGARVTLLKPETYMNESGRSVGEALRYLKLDLADIAVFHDELDLVPGKIKLKVGGGNAGHNGLRSLTAHIGNEYRRVRIGIGHPGSKDAVVHFVLHDFAKSDAEWLEPVLDAIAGAAGRLAHGDDARFLSEVARVLQASDSESRRQDEPETERPAVSAPRRHPAGERAAKWQSALAENLKKWLKGRNPGS
jgi:PTH1 family peptidyl-tRNA hydrolase